MISGNLQIVFCFARLALFKEALELRIRISLTLYKYIADARPLLFLGF